MGLAVVLLFGTQGVVVGTDGDGVSDVSERNVFGSVNRAVFLRSSNDRIAGNLFGLGADGTTPIAMGDGILFDESSSGNRVGTDLDGISDEFERNVFGNCNTAFQFHEFPWASGVNSVVGNWIGLDASGDPAGCNTGLLMDGEVPGRLVSRNRIESNGVGIALANGGMDPASSGNCLGGNATGFAHESAAAVVFESNWWGAADGPSGVGAGAGDAISVTGSGSIDYTPWVTSGCPAPEPGAAAAGLVTAATLAATAARRRTVGV